MLYSNTVTQTVVKENSLHVIECTRQLRLLTRTLLHGNNIRIGAEKRLLVSDARTLFIASKMMGLGFH